MRWSALALLGGLSAVYAAPTAANGTYDYVVVGSGAGGGPLACRLAMAGHKTLLIEAGNDQGSNPNTTIPGFQGVVAGDPLIRWDMYVNHYQDLERAKRDPKFVYSVGDSEYVGLNPPAGAEPLGILYPRAGVLGGCVTHNALIWITPHASDWNNIANITGDNTWDASNMGQYLDNVYDWLSVEPTDPTIVLGDLQLAQHLASGAAVEGLGPDPLAAVSGLAELLLENPNSRTNPKRDSTEGFFQIPLIMKNGVRDGVRDRIVNTVNAGYPLTVMTETFVTKVVFDETKTPPQAVGVEYLAGSYLYSASPLSGGSKGTPGAVNVTKEVILSGGTYNTVQMLKLSGVGPKAELESFGIPVISDLPGVGTNLQDRYEVPVNVEHPKDFALLKGCTFDGKAHDKCYTQWMNNPYVLGLKGTYASNGLAAAMAFNSDYASDSNIDLFIFGGPVDFTGYFPGWGDSAVINHNYYSWYTLKAHTRNHAGTIELRSANPLDTPIINFNYFDTGTTEGGADDLDVNALVQAVNISRQALKRYHNYNLLGGTNFTEVNPGSNVQSQADLETYVKDVAWGHHASCSCPIGADDDPMAVLNSKFQVRGTQGLRVVDASVFPTIPGVFIQAPILMMSEKAADVILNG